MLTRTVVLPTLHPDQVAAYEALKGSKRQVIRCGRRWGKTQYGQVICGDSVINSERVGWFAPDYKILSETYDEIQEILEPIKRSSSEQKGLFRAITGGRIDFWTLSNKRAGRSRKYHKVIIDEAAFTDDDMMDVWEKSIEPTLLDFEGTCIVLSNTNGISPDNFLYRICKEPRFGFKEFHAPTRNNPYMPPAELERLKASKHPMIWQQEYEAAFIDWSGVAVFDEQKMLVEGVGVAYPAKCDYVIAFVDTASKDGAMHDGTAVTYLSFSQWHGIPLVILDWDIVQINGAMLEDWVPQVARTAEALAQQCGARQGFRIFVEDKASGIVLIQKMQQRGMPVDGIDTKLTALGKEARAIAASDYVYQGKVKFSTVAHDKVVMFKDAERNHLITQFCGFRMGQKHGADDLLDTLTYGILLTLGDSDGF